MPRRTCERRQLFCLHVAHAHVLGVALALALRSIYYMASMRQPERIRHQVTFYICYLRKAQQRTLDSRGGESMRRSGNMLIIICTLAVIVASTLRFPASTQASDHAMRQKAMYTQKHHQETLTRRPSRQRFAPRCQLRGTTRQLFGLRAPAFRLCSISESLVSRPSLHELAE